MLATNITPFKALFGVEEQDIKTRCILMPFTVPAVLKAWQITELSRGLLYRVAQTPHFTLIHTRMGAGLVGDAVLYLKQTQCKELFLFGSCGLLEEKENKKLELGSLIVPTCCYALESFSDFLLNEHLFDELPAKQCFYPHTQLLENFLSYSSVSNCATNFDQVICATISSLKLEEEKLPLLLQAGLQVVDMECSAFLAAAQAVGLPALAVFWVSDIVKYQPFYYPLAATQKAQVDTALLKLAALLAAYCAEKA